MRIVILSNAMWLPSYDCVVGRARFDYSDYSSYYDMPYIQCEEAMPHWTINNKMFELVEFLVNK